MTAPQVFSNARLRLDQALRKALLNAVFEFAEEEKLPIQGRPLRDLMVPFSLLRAVRWRSIWTLDHSRAIQLRLRYRPWPRLAVRL